jgi:SAM-dependent methyltransferase
VQAVRKAAQRTVSRAVVDSAYKVETTGVVELADLGLSSPDLVDYRPSGWLDLRRSLPPGDVSADDVFLDLGAGKGRVVLMACRYPFKRVIGVELSPELSEIARRNLARSRHAMRCRDVEVVTADVVHYRVPDDVSVVYMFNPFRGPVFDAAVARLIDSVDRRPRALRLIYRKPEEHDRLMRTGRFRPVGTVPGHRLARTYVVEA